MSGGQSEMTKITRGELAQVLIKLWVNGKSVNKSDTTLRVVELRIGLTTFLLTLEHAQIFPSYILWLWLYSVGRLGLKMEPSGALGGIGAILNPAEYDYLKLQSWNLNQLTEGHHQGD